MISIAVVFASVTAFDWHSSTLLGWGATVACLLWGFPVLLYRAQQK